MGADNMLTVMERAMEDGHSVLIENMGESIDAVLNPVITRATFKKGRSLYVKLGDKDVEYNKNFRLFLHTKLSNPHYPPEIQAETTLINFTVTEQVRCARRRRSEPGRAEAVRAGFSMYSGRHLLPLLTCCCLPCTLARHLPGPGGPAAGAGGQQGAARPGGDQDAADHPEHRVHHQAEAAGGRPAVQAERR
jgi:hypothetical protein